MGVKFQDYQRMNKETKKTIVPKLRFPEFREVWREDTLVKVAKFRRGSFPQPYGLPKWYDEENGMPFVQVFDVSDDLQLKSKTKNKISKLASKQSVFIPKGTVIITIQGSIGRVAITQYDAYIDRTLLLFEKFLKPLEKKFFAYVLQLLFEIEKEKAPGGIIKTITKEVLSDFKIYIPDLIEQQKIASCLSSIDDLITAQSQKLDTLKSHKKGLMQQLFPAEGESVPRLRFREFRDAGEWEIRPLSEIAENLDSRRIPITSNIRVRGDIPYYGASGIIDYVNDHIFDEDLLCVSEDGANLVVRTYPIAFSISGRTWVNNHAHVLKFESNFTRVIVEKYLNSISLEDFLTGMAQPKLNRGQLDIIPIPLPQLDEQQRIATCLSSLDDLITAQIQKLEALKVHKKGLMQQLFPNVISE